MLIVDPLMLEQAKALPRGVREFFKTITDIGKSNWMLIPTGVAVALALVLQQRYGGWRNAAAYGLIASTIGFVFVSIGGAGLIANLTKNILGRARPKLFETAGRSTSIFSPSTRISPRCRPATPPICLPLPP
jgi:undecaprenyl-diphosphatase